MAAVHPPVATATSTRVPPAARIRPWSWSRWEIGFWAVLALGFFVPGANLPLMTQMLIFGIFAMSLDVLLGYRGIPSMGHAAFFGIGAYTAGFLGKYGWSEPISGLLAAALVAGVVGALTGRLVHKLHGVALLMVTLGLNLILYDLVQRSTGITGGDDGLQGIQIDPVLGLFRFDMLGRTSYVYVLAVCFLMFVLVRALLRSPFGLALEGARDNSRRMIALGAPVEGNVSLAFAVSAAVAAVGGALMTQTTQFTSPEILSFQRSADVLTMLIIGGAGRLYGALIGAIIFTFMHDTLSAMDPVFWYFWIGLALVLIVAFFRRGIVPTLIDAWTRRAARASGRAG